MEFVVPSFACASVVAGYTNEKAADIVQPLRRVHEWLSQERLLMLACGLTQRVLTSCSQVSI